MGYGITHIYYRLSLVANKTGTLRNTTSSKVFVFVFEDKCPISQACSNLHHNLDHIKLNWSWFKLHWDIILSMGHGNTHIYYRSSLVEKKTDTIRNTTYCRDLVLFWEQMLNIPCLFQLAPQSWQHQIELVLVQTALRLDCLYWAW